MSYRAFKRLLGETSLERKCRFLLGTGSLILITASFWFYARQTETIAYTSTANSGRLLMPLILRGLHDEESPRRLAMDEFEQQARMRWSKAISTYTFNILKPNTSKPGQRPDADEIGVLDRFQRDPDYFEESRSQ